MAKRDKLIARIRARPPEADFEDVRGLLEGFGWQMARQKGSHVTFTRQGEHPIAVPMVRGRKVKRTYLAVICDRLGLDD